MMDDQKPTLEGFRDYNTDDGEEWWIVSTYNALEATLGEMESWPKARVLNPTTGEIFEAPLAFLVDSIAKAIEAGHEIRVEPVKEKNPPQGEEIPNRLMVVAGNRRRELVDVTHGGDPWAGGTPTDTHRKTIPGSWGVWDLVLEDGAHIYWPEEAKVPRYVAYKDGKWVDADAS